MKFEGDILIIDPLNIMHEENERLLAEEEQTAGDDPDLSMFNMRSGDDWYDTEFGKDLSVIGIHTFLTANGADSAGETVVNTDTDEVLGRCCSDSGLLSVMLLSEVLEYNPAFSEFMERYSDLFTVIRGFSGEVEEVTETGDSFPYWAFVGKGTVNFKTEDV